MDVERALLSKAINSSSVEELVARGIEDRHFGDPDLAAVYRTCVEHMRRYTAAPSLDAVRRQHDDFSLALTTDTLEYLIDRFIDSAKRREAIRLGEHFQEAIDDPEQVADIEMVALEMAKTLTEVVPSPKAGRYSDMTKRTDEYERRKVEGVDPGIMFGIPTIDHLTLGIQQHELVVIAAFLGVGKSLILQWTQLQAYLQGKTPLFISLEMDAESLFRRWDVMATNIRYHALKALELEDSDFELWRRVAKAAEDARPERDIIVRDDIGAVTTDRVLAEAIRYKPDIIGIDYVNLMSAPRGAGNSIWEKLTFITADLKRVARTLGIPIVIAAQGTRDTARSGTNLETVANSISIARDCDIFIGLHQDEDDELLRQLQVGLFKNRDGKKLREGVLMNWELDTMSISEKTAADLMQRTHGELVADG